MRHLIGVILAALVVCLTAPASAQSAASLHLVFVMDGLRPDSINEADTPNLNRLRREGVAFENSHAVFPTVTRVNSTSISTGSYPARHGIMGNTIYVPAVDPQRAFRNDSFDMLMKLDEVTAGGMVTTAGIAERLERSGRKVVVLSSGSPGSSLLLAPKAPHGIGTLINGNGFSGKSVAFPLPVSDAILKRFGPQPKKGGAKDSYDSAVDWSMDVLREYVLPELKPALVLTWMTEPDHIQHAFGPGAPESIAAIRNDDRQIGLLLQKLDALGMRAATNIVVVSDHGFSRTVHTVNVGRALVDAGLVAPAESGDVIIASSGQAIALHVRDREPGRIRAVVEFLQRQPWCGVVFTAARSGGEAHEGSVAGTFALEYVHLGGHARSPDIVFTFPWSSAPNRYGVRGADYAQTVSGKTGPVDTDAAGHGGIGPWTVRNTMLAWGPDFKRGALVRTPTSNVDVAPTLMHLLGVTAGQPAMDGRPLLEAFAAGPDPEQIPIATRALRVSNGSYRAVLQVSEAGGRRYIDKAWREADGVAVKR